MTLDFKQADWRACLACSGSGKRGIVFCPDCGGSGMWYAHGEHNFYWHRPMSLFQIGARNWEWTISFIIDGLLVLALAINSLLFLYQIYLAGDVWPAMKFYWFSSSASSLLFWTLLTSHLYLVYRLWRLTGRLKPWYQVLQKRRRLRINIADYFSFETLRQIDQAWVRSRLSGKVLTADALAVYLLQTPDVVLLFSRLGLTISEAQKGLLSLSLRDHQVQENEGVSQGVRRAFLIAALLAAQRHHRRVQSLDLFLALMQVSQHIPLWLSDKGIEDQHIRHVHTWIDLQHALFRKYRSLRRAAGFRSRSTINRSYTAIATPYLDRFSQDLTLAAKMGALPMIVGRDQEFTELYRALESGVSAVVLVGENGVGKRSLIDQLANLMVADDVPALLQDKRLVRVDLPSLVAGAVETGEIQERMMRLTREVIRSGNIILYIENIHTVVGVSGRGAEQLDLSEVLAQQIRDPRLVVIGSTTPADWHRALETTSLGQEMRRIIVTEPEREEAIEMVLAHVPLWEAQFPVFISYQAVVQAVDLSQRYIHDQQLPEKAVLLLQETAAGVTGSRQERQLISGQDVARIVSEKVKVPVTEVSQDESEQLLHLQDNIHERIIGQDEAVTVVVSALQRARVELRDLKRPIVSLLFLGPTGVGKTELAKAVAASYFGNEQRMIRLDMSEYQNAESLARLIGGADRDGEGLLTEAVRKQPYSLILLDELEKAHRDIINIFLQVMDDGRLTDAHGRTVDFTNTIIIATSNAASQFIQDQVRAGTAIDQVKQQLLDRELADYYRPELLNRFDAIVVFKPLTESEILQIAELLIRQVAARLRSKGIQLEVSPEALAQLAKDGFDPVFGARPLRRLIQERIDTALAQYLLKGAIGRRDRVLLNSAGQIEVIKAAPLG